MRFEVAKFLTRHIPGAELYNHYSGRYMFGEMTTAVVLSEPLVKAKMTVLEAMHVNEEELNTIIKRTEQVTQTSDTTQDLLRFDQFGRGSIVY